MMRFLPRSLFSRMVLVLLTGLILAQVAGLAIYWRDRDEFMHRAMGLRSVQRVADVIRLLDTMKPDERSRVVAVLNSPQLRIALDAQPLADVLQTSSDQRDEARLFTAALRRSLGDEWPLVIRVTDAPFLRGPPPGYGPGMMKGMMGGGIGPGPGPGAFAFPGLSFVVQVRLHDGVLVTLDSRQASDSTAWPFRLTLSLAVLLTTLIVLALVAVRWVTKPLNTLAEAAERLGADINRPPLDENGPLEVSRAARAFNTMQQRLASFIRDRARVFSAMSHDLKTPITRLRLRAEMLEDEEMRTKFVNDLDEMQAMVSGTLDFLRGVEREEAPQAIDIMALLSSLKSDAEEVHGSVEIEGQARGPYIGKPQGLKRCLANLIDNAIKYGCAASVRVTDSPQELQIVVGDEGPGIPEVELDRVFEPFHRVEASRNRSTGGTGLGLTIARNIARAHGGELILRNGSNGGLDAVLTLPRGSSTLDASIAYREKLRPAASKSR